MKTRTTILCLLISICGLSATVLAQQAVTSATLGGRNYLDLAAPTPAVTRANPVANQRFAETSAAPGTQISVAGQRNINNDGTGATPNANFGRPTAAADPRQIQFGLRLSF